MNEEIPKSFSTTACIESLHGLLDGIDENDLPGLAKMHELCEELVVAGIDALSCQEAKDLVSSLEALILGKADDPSTVMRKIVASISSLPNTMTSLPVEPDCPTAPGIPSDETVAASMDRVFEDDEPDRHQETSPEELVPESEVDTVAAKDEPASGKDESQPGYVAEPLIIGDDETEMVAGFAEEAGEHLDSIEAALLDVERAPDDTEAIDSLFRPFHTIKGAAGFLNLRDIVSLTHEAETLLDQARKGTRKVTAGLIDLIFEVVDIIKVQFASIREYLSDPTSESVPQPPIENMIAKLRDIVAGRIEPVGIVPNTGGSQQTVGENLVEQGAVPQEVVDYAVAKQDRESDPKKVGETLIEIGAASAKQISQALRPQSKTKPETTTKIGNGGGEQSVRIDTRKLDSLIDMVGELVIAQTQVSASSQLSMAPKLSKDVAQATKIVRDVQDAAMAMRMIPIGPTFQKMARLVRDVSRKVGKT